MQNSPKIIHIIVRFVRPPPAVVAARKREIAAKYARANAKKFGPLTLAAIRASELTRLYKSRWPSQQLPCDDEGEIAARVMVNHLARLRDAPRRISRWLDHWAPWLDLVSHERLMGQALDRPLRFKADKIAWKLRVTAEERTRLGLRTIGAIDQNSDQRRAAARERQRERQRARREAQGSIARSDYEAHAVSREKPWIAMGISRRTYYRRKVAQVRASHISEIYGERTCATERDDAAAKENSTDRNH